MFRILIKLWLSVVFSTFVFILEGQVDILVTPPNCGESDGTMEVIGLGGTSPYLFDWSDGGPHTQTRTDISSGSYQVKVTDANGCVGYATAEVIGSAGIVASISPQGSVSIVNPCSGGPPNPVFLTGNISGGSGNPEDYITNWGASQQITVTSPGTYKFTAYNTAIDGAVNCPAEAEIYIEEVPVRCSSDPNEIHGPEGYGDENWISIKDELHYTILFENDPVLATAPARRVQVDLPLDEHLDPTSFRLNDYGFANMDFEIPENNAFYSQQLNVVDSLEVFVQVTAGIDIANNKAFWILEAIDPATGLLPNDKGLLPVNDTITRRGEGYFTFSISPKNNTLTGDSIREQAAIIFDDNETILTNTETHLIDAFAPASTMAPITAASTDLQLTLTWDGQDDTGGVGIQNYDLYYAQNGGIFSLYQDNIIDNFILFSVVPGADYAFYTIATDNVGNRELPKSVGEVFFESDAVPNIIANIPERTSYCVGDSIILSWETYLVDSVDLFYTIDGMVFNPIQNEIIQPSTSFNWVVPDSLGDLSIRFLISDSNDPFLKAQSVLISTHSLPAIFAGADITLCEGFGTVLQGQGGVTYNWSPATFLTNPNTANPTAAPSTSTSFQLTAVDNNGCTNSDEVLVTVASLPSVTITDLPLEVCVNANDILLNGTPAGGTFSGFGVSNNSFQPSLTGPGTIGISYNYVDGNGCSGSASQIVEVLPVPTVNFSGLESTYLIADAPATLIGNPPNGTFSGPGVTNDLFNPNQAGAGVHQITYSFTDDLDCSNTAVQEVTVFNNTAVFFTGLAPNYCENEPAISLNGNPQGGVFSGPGVIDNSFDPTLAGVGIHEVVYTLNSELFTDSVTVLPVTMLSIAGVEDAFCMTDEPIIVNGNPVGGTLSGPGVNGNYFDLPAAGPGDHLITYTYENANGCTSVTNLEVSIFALPMVSFTGLAANYSDTDSAVVLEGFPMGGTFSGSGMVDSLFDPGIVANGSHLITYTYTDPIGCSNSYSQEVVVNALNTVFLSGLAATYCQNDPTVTLAGNPAGGTFSGPGILDNSFNPNIAGAGFHTITYTVVLSDGNTSTATNNTNVNPIPEINISNLADAYCINASDVQLIASPFGGEWSGTGVSDFFFSPEQAGVGSHLLTYTYTSNNTECTATKERMISVGEAVTASIENLAPVYCLESDASLLTLIPEGGTLTGNGIVNETFFPSLAGEGEHLITYDYEDEGGCTASFNATVLVTSTINTVSITGLESLVCENTPSIELTGIPSGGTFSGPGIVDNIFTPSEVGTVEITYTLDFGDCGATHTEKIEILAAPNLTIEALPGTAVCAGDSITLSASGGDVYSWSTGDTGSSIQVDATGTYEVVTTEANGCTDASDISVIVYEMEQPMISQMGTDSLVSTIGDAYQWYLNGSQIAGANDEFFIPVIGGDYTVEVTDNNGCTGISTAFPFIVTSISSLTLDNISIRPNPAKDYVTISFVSRLLLSDLLIEILDAKGSLVWQKNYGNINSDFTERIEVEDLAGGVYQVKVLSAQGSYVDKLVVVR